jgi:hypothetical protein
VVAALAPTRPTPAPRAAEAHRQEPAPERQPQAIVPALAPTKAAPGQEAARAEVEPDGAPAPRPRPESQTAGVPSITRPLPAAQPAPTAAAKPAKQAAGVAPEPSPAPTGETATAAEPEKQVAVARQPAPARKAAADAKIATDAAGGLVIVFATNSSYFPPGARKQLSRLLSGVDPEKRYEVAVEVAVSGATKVVGAKSPAEAALYNKWLAERRLERVQEWLLEHSNPDTVSIRPEYLADDESRRVVVRLTPVG